MSIVSPADERVGDRVESARLVCARALEEVTRVLVQKRWQDGAADHDVGKAVGSDSAIALAVTLQTLRVVGSVPGLVDAGKNTYPDDGNRIGAGLKCELELQLRCQRRSVVIIDDVEIGEDAKNPLLLLDPDLLDGDLFGGIIHRYRGHHLDRKSTRLNSSHLGISYAVFCLKKKRRYTHQSRLAKKRTTKRLSRSDNQLCTSSSYPVAPTTTCCSRILWVCVTL